MCATDAAFHLVHKIDVEHTLARLAHYEALNKAHIAQHQQQREQESAQQDEADAVARHERMRRAQQVREEQEREQLEQDADEKALVAALEEGRDIDDAMREREARREARVAAAQQRELAAAARQQHDAVPTAPRVLSAEAQAYAHEVGQSDYVGAFATLHDGTQLCDARGAPPSAGGLGGSGYVDPWWRTDAALGAQFRAGGYDWQHEVWQRGLASLCDGVSLRPM